MRRTGFAVVCALATGAATAVAQTAPRAAQQLARDVFAELIEINTVNTHGSTTEAARAMAARLLAAGFPSADVQVLGPHPRKGNLVARLQGTGRQPPLLLLAHLDVVDALPEDWTVDPFTFLERDGFFYGRGTTDDKAMAAIWVANLIRYRREGFVPDRDLIVALTADEEGGPHNGVTWLLEHHRDLIAAEYALNEGGGGQIKNGRRIANRVQASEKVYQSFRLEVTNPGGHSSIPRPENAIYQLAAGLTRLARFRFPVRLNEVTRAFFERTARVEADHTGADMAAILQSPSDPRAGDRLSATPYYNALLRTTCVATRLEAGHAENALPQTARAVVNCRILPNDSPDEIRAELERVLSDPAISVTPMNVPTPSPPSPLRRDVLEPIERLTETMWPGVPVVPVMSTGATDGLYLRNAGIATYGVSGLFSDVDDIRAHGRDERIGVQAFYEGQEFLYRLVKALAGGGD